MPYKSEARQRQASRQAMRRKRAAESEITIPAPLHAADRERAEGDLLYFMRTFLGHLFPIPFSETHVQVIREIERVLNEGGCFAYCLWRGAGKSTITQAAILWAILTGKRRLVVLVNATISEAKEAISDIRDLLEDSESRIARAFPEAFSPFHALDGSPRRAVSQTIGGRKSKIVMAVDKLAFPVVSGSKCSGSMIIAKSAQSNLRGLRRKGMRPDCVVIDDAEDSESAWSESSQKRLRRLYDSEIQGLRGPKSKMAVFNLATIQRKGCIADIYCDPAQKRAWNGRRYSFVQSFSANPELWEQYETLRRKDHGEATRFYRDNREAMDEGTRVAWPENHAADCLSAYQEAINWKVDNGQASFLSELQNSPEAETVEQAEQLTTHDVTAKSVSLAKNVAPDDSQAVTVGIDVSKYLLHYSVVSFNARLSGHVVDYGTYDVADMPDTSKAILKALNGLNDEIIKPGWMGIDGTRHAASIVCVDAGYFPEVVGGQFCRANGFLRYKPCKGRGSGTEKTGAARLRYFVPKDRSGGVIVGNQWYIGRAGNGILAHHNADHWKEDAQSRWKKAVNDDGGLTIYQAERGWRDLLKFASHQCAERLVEEVKNGRLTRVFRRESKSNHWLDTICLNLLGASILGVGDKTPEEKPANAEAKTFNPPVHTPRPPPRPRIIRPIRIRTIYRDGTGPLPF